MDGVAWVRAVCSAFPHGVLQHYIRRRQASALSSPWINEFSSYSSKYSYLKTKHILVRFKRVVWRWVFLAGTLKMAFVMPGYFTFSNVVILRRNQVFFTFIKECIFWLPSDFRHSPISFTYCISKAVVEMSLHFKRKIVTLCVSLLNVQNCLNI